MNHQPLQLRTQYATEECRHRRQLYKSNHSSPKRYIIELTTTQDPCICNRNTRRYRRVLRNRRSDVSICSTTDSVHSGPPSRISSSCLLIPRIRVVKVLDRPPSVVLAVSAPCRKCHLTVTTRRVVAVVEAEEVLTLGLSWSAFHNNPCGFITHQPLSRQARQRGIQV